jgi:hypothetical protein
METGDRQYTGRKGNQLLTPQYYRIYLYKRENYVNSIVWCKKREKKSKYKPFIT